jgi:hypothetical protein
MSTTAWGPKATTIGSRRLGEAWTVVVVGVVGDLGAAEVPADGLGLEQLGLSELAARAHLLGPDRPPGVVVAGDHVPLVLARTCPR